MKTSGARNYGFVSLVCFSEVANTPCQFALQWAPLDGCVTSSGTGVLNLGVGVSSGSPASGCSFPGGRSPEADPELRCH